MGPVLALRVFADSTFRFASSIFVGIDDRWLWDRKHCNFRCIRACVVITACVVRKVEGHEYVFRRRVFVALQQAMDVITVQHGALFPSLTDHGCFLPNSH